ncbi:MAG TPA: hypothetical protein VIL37_21030 [Natronosporangium sp.]
MDQTKPTGKAPGKSRRAFLTGGLRLGAMAAVLTVPAPVVATAAEQLGQSADNSTDRQRTTAHGGLIHTQNAHGGVAHEHGGVTHTHEVMVHALDERTIRAVDTAQQAS